MQLERGKSSTGLLGSFQSIIRQEGYVYVVTHREQLNQVFFFIRFGRLYRGRRGLFSLWLV